MANRIGAIDVRHESAEGRRLATNPGCKLPAPPEPLQASFTILGIDPGLDRTGYAIIESASHRVLDAGLVRSSAKSALPERLREIEIGLDEILSEHRIDLMAVEELYAHYKHPRTAILMGHARGVILLAAARRRIDLVSLSATHIKRTLTGNGHAGKLQMQRAMIATLKLKVMPDPPDVADALAAAWCAAVTRMSGRH
ncbi:MAG TPA: crossover junction endodeoxyribonuclease RuvC [Phycisphaerae bacterium]|nr:crossover junction endodeoxyribonuclease RuvC [Phycisphaerae bacterium]